MDGLKCFIPSSTVEPLRHYFKICKQQQHKKKFQAVLDGADPVEEGEEVFEDTQPPPRNEL